MADRVTNNQPTYALIIPALNPDYRLIDLVKAVHIKSSQMEIVIVDDGSAPEFQTIFEELKTNDKLSLIRHKKNRGKGAALKTGIKYSMDLFPHCVGIITADSDGQHSVEDILKTAKEMEENPNALVIGVRDFLSKNVPFKSRYGNKITSDIFKLVTSRSCSDTQTGLRGIPARYITKALGVQGERYDYEMNFLLQFTGWQIPFVEMSIETIYHNENKGSHFRPVQDSARIYRVIFSYWVTSLLRGPSKQSPRRFLMASLLSFAIDMSLFFIVKTLLLGGIATAIFWSTIISRVLSGFFNFTINRKWVFSSSGKIGKQALEYLALFVVQMVLSGVLVSVLSLIPPLSVVKCVVDLALFFISYQIQTRFIFKKKYKMKGGRL